MQKNTKFFVARGALVLVILAVLGIAGFAAARAFGTRATPSTTETMSPPTITEPTPTVTKTSTETNVPEPSSTPTPETTETTTLIPTVTVAPTPTTGPTATPKPTKAPTATPTPKPATPTPTPTVEAWMEKRATSEVYDGAMQERADNGYDSIPRSATLDTLAQSRAEELALLGVINHDNMPNEANWEGLMSGTPYGDYLYWHCGDNFAATQIGIGSATYHRVDGSIYRVTCMLLKE